MKYRIDYNLRGQARFWICESDRKLQQRDALAAILTLHAPPDPVSSIKQRKPFTISEQRAAVSELGISDVRFQLL